MAFRKSIFIFALAITVCVFLSVLYIGNVFDSKREAVINQETQETYASITEMQTFWLMSESYGGDMACLAFKTKLQELDQSVWNLGIKLDQYRVASEEFRQSQYYKDQKKLFNENEVTYLLLLRKVQSQCNYKQSILLYFYKNSKDCSNCDDQSYVLTDINTQIPNEVSVFSFDTDLNITTINLLEQYYNISEYPCTVVDDTPYCGIRDKKFLIDAICKSEPNISVCEQS